MSARLFTTVYNPKQGVDATVHLADLRNGDWRPSCGTRAAARELVVQGATHPQVINCERCLKKLNR